MLRKFWIALLLVTVCGVAQAQETQTYSGRLDASTPTQSYKFLLKTDDAVVITTTVPDDDLDTVLRLYNPADELVAENDDASLGTRESRIAFIAREDGVYRVDVGRYDDSTSGSYDLEILVGDTSILEYGIEMSGTRETQDSEHFRFHYTRSGGDRVDLTFLEAIEQAFEDSWRVEVDQMNWPAPLADDAMGGNSLYDVYIMDSIGTGEEALGFTSPELFVGDNPNTPEKEEYASTSYIAIDNDFNDVEFGEDQDAVTVMRATAFHEFHHAIQFGFDGAEPHHWFAEATSTWMETVGAGKDQDATGYVATAFDYPELCLGTTAEDESIMYGEWTFMQFLTDEFGKEAVHDLWREIADYEGFDALDQLLSGYGTTIPHEVARYRIKNLARDYKLAPLFNATVWLENTITGTGIWTYGESGSGVQELGANYFEFSLPRGVYDVELRSADRHLELWAIGVQKSGLDAFALGRGGGINTNGYERVYLMVFNPTYDNNVDECVYTDYQISVTPGKGTTNPVDSTWNRAYFEALK
ncbi:MAG: MXAN_6640 family putative metalloprotease [Anaerolineae bacterium]